MAFSEKMIYLSEHHSAGLNTSILVWTALPDGSNMARAHVYGRRAVKRLLKTVFYC